MAWFGVAALLQGIHCQCVEAQGRPSVSVASSLPSFRHGVRFAVFVSIVIFSVFHVSLDMIPLYITEAGRTCISNLRNAFLHTHMFANCRCMSDC